MKPKSKSQRTFWFWCVLSEIALKKSTIGKKRPIGEVWENLILVSATNELEAYKKASDLGAMVNGDSNGSLRLDGSPAKNIFLGIQDIGVLSDGEIFDGCEILFRIKRETLRKAKSRILTGKNRSKCLSSIAKILESERR